MTSAAYEKEVRVKRPGQKYEMSTLWAMPSSISSVTARPVAGAFKMPLQ